MPRRIAAPWTVIEHAESFEVRSANDLKVAYVYFRDGPAVVGTGVERLTRDEARRVAANIAKLPTLLSRK